HPLHRTGRYAAQHVPAPYGADGGDALVRHETGDQTGQESQSAGHRAATNVTYMDITIHATFLPHTDPDTSLAFYRDRLGFEVRNDVGHAGMRWVTVGPPGQPGTSIVLHPPAVDPGITDDERRTITETYSAFVQGFMPTLARPEVDVLDGLTTAIIVDQQRMGADPRSTVGTATDANAMLRILFSRLGKPHIGPPNAYSFNVPSVRA